VKGILRLAKIARVFSRYRLDTFFENQKLPRKLNFLVGMTRLRSPPNQPRGERLRKALVELGPVFVKLGQLLSTRPDLIPEDIISELDQLQDNVAPFDSNEFIAIIEKALDSKVDDLFAAFDRTPLASASVAQVHAATLKNGKEVVVKAIRPGIDKIIDQDLALMSTVAQLVEKTKEGRRLRPTDIVNDYKITIRDELNLQREAANSSQLGHNFKNSPILYVPPVYWHYTNEYVMVSERIYGIPVTDIDRLTRCGTDFKILAERGVEIFFTQVFSHNFFHADMHPGNIFVDTSDPFKPKYIAIDCAIMGTLTDDDQYYLARNLLAIFRRDYRQVAELHVLSGWVPQKTNINEFSGTIRTVCEPIFERPLNEISFGEILVSLFQTARRYDMEVQPSLVLLQKTLLNIEGLGRQLYPQLDLWATAHPFLENWLKDRVSPKAVIDQFKHHGPEWLEQYPKIPQMLYRTLKQLENLDEALDKRKQQQVPSRRRGKLLGAALVGVGMGLTSQEWIIEQIGQTPTIGLGLAAVGIVILALR